MEDQFVVRLPESIQDRVLEDVKKGNVQKVSIKMVSGREGILTYEGKTYTGCLADLPCITESYKTLDNRQFVKIADISKVFVFADEGLQEELESASVSGLSSPMKYVRNRRFRKRLAKVPIVEEIERAVAQLLEKDREALRVDVQLMNKEKEETEEDVSSFAAEIELNMMEHEKLRPNVTESAETKNEELAKKEAHLKQILIHIQEKKEHLAAISNPILQKRFRDTLAQMEQEKEQLEEEIRQLLAADEKKRASARTPHTPRL